MSDKVSLITTVFNEQGSISEFLQSLTVQSRLPDEIVIVDAESHDQTVPIIQEFIRTYPSISIRLLIKPGNRSVGRNEAIRAAKFDFIAATDAGCVLDPNWLAEIAKPFNDPGVDFIGGWYQPITKTAWQQALAVMLITDVSRINQDTFLPSTRSMAFKRGLWARIGGFNEQLAHNEDTPFSMKARRAANFFIFQPKAIVYWKLMNNNQELFRVARRYAFGDGECLLFRSQYIIVYTWLAITVWLGFMIQVKAVVFLPPFILCLGYLFTPLFQLFKKWRGSYIFQVPLMKGTLVAANLLGFFQGLSSRIILNKGILH